MRRFILSWLVVICLSFIGLTASGGTSSCDFNSGLPRNATAYGTANVDGSGGVDNTGVLKLTLAHHSAQMGSFIVHPFDGSQNVVSFVATFKAQIGSGTGADGMAFHFAPKLPDAPFADLPTTGLSVIFDTYKNSPADMAPCIRIRANKSTKFEESVPDLRSDHFVDVMVKLDPDGTLDVAYDNELIFTNVPTGLVNLSNARFAFGARTGSRTDNHWVDDLKIVTETSPPAFVETFEPTGNNAATVPMIRVTINDSKAKLKGGSVKMKFDNEAVAAETTESNGKTVVDYEPSELLQPGSLHRVSLQFSDTGKAAKQHEFNYAFRVTSQVYISK